MTGFVRGILPVAPVVAANVAQDHGLGARNVKNYSLSIRFNAQGIVEDYDQMEMNRSRDSL
ncbi:hypothetical protein ACFOPN_05990 [Xanthomonas hyacinthi]|uniref:hypothetical protein n=1 Tax=Xanthomonas hyacinthi TaxID=56455 RepID=UPI00069D264D